MDIKTRFIRVLVSGIYGYLAVAFINYLGVQFSPEQSAAIEGGLLVVCTAAINALIGMIGAKYPIIERVLGGSRPVYMKKEETK